MAVDDPLSLVVGCTPWARRVFDRDLCRLPGRWQYASTREELRQMADGLEPWHWIFVLHWRWTVPARILQDYAGRCIGFHLGALPSERGGTPLQWRILEGQQRAILTMFSLTEEVDAGPVLDTTEVPLDGSAEAVYARAMQAAADGIRAMLRQWPAGCAPTPQEPYGVRVTPRRTPEESRLPLDGVVIEQMYDRIRMVDAPGYPNAFLDYGGMRFTFRRAVLYDGRIEADVTIRPLDAPALGAMEELTC